jgi:hypothetical protein
MLGGMNKIILMLVLLIPSLAHAVICKTVEPDGTVSYADVPADECAQAVKLPDYSRYAPRPIQQQWSRTAPAGGSLVAVERYQSMAIARPEPGGTVRDNSGQGKVDVAIALQPGLQPGHRVMLYLDGSPVGSGFEGTTIELSGVRRGGHSLRAAVLDPAGQRLIEAPAVRFTMRQPSLLEPARSPVEPEPPQPEPLPPTQSPDYTVPPADYSPGPGAAPATPAANNPAFAPKYTP